MYTVVVILILIVSVLLGLIVLVQNSKGGGLVSNFGGANQMMGVRQTTDFLEKATWTIGGILVVLCLISSITLPKKALPRANWRTWSLRFPLWKLLQPQQRCLPHPKLPLKPLRLRLRLRLNNWIDNRIINKRG